MKAGGRAARQLALRPRCPVQRRSFYATSTALQAPPPSSTPDTSRTTSFGFETIPESSKNARVGAVFSSVASSYDTMNDLMSLGIHRLWKDHFVRTLNPGSTTDQQEGWSILDVAGGTGDIAFRLLDHATTINHDTTTTVTIADINPDMLAEGRKRAAHLPWSQRLTFVEGNAESMPSIPSSSMDLYTVAFGIRNFTDKPRALREAYRILKPGGVFACLEFSSVQNPVLDAVYKRWSFGAIPLIGQVVAGDRDSYRYLVESIAEFPGQEEFSGMIAEAGFEVPEGGGCENLSGGIAAIHRGVKPRG